MRVRICYMTFVPVHNKAKIRSIAEIHFLLHDLRFPIVMTKGIIIKKQKTNA